MLVNAIAAVVHDNAVAMGGSAFYLYKHSGAIERPVEGEPSSPASPGGADAKGGVEGLEMQQANPLHKNADAGQPQHFGATDLAEV